MRTFNPKKKIIKLPDIKNNQFRYVQNDNIFNNMSNSFNEGRAVGGFKMDKSRILTKRTIKDSELYSSTDVSTKLTKIQRQNVRYDPPIITRSMVEKGAESLLNRGYIPKELDLTNVMQNQGSPVMN